MLKKKIPLVLSVVLTMVMTLSAFAAFSDVGNNFSWAKEAIDKMSDSGIINGYSDQIFGPADEITKIQAMLLISRMLGYVDTTYSPYLETITEMSKESLSGIKLDYPDEIAFLIYKGVFTPEEIKKLRYAAETSDTAKIILMMIYTGTRIGEITSIKHQNVFVDTETPYMIGGIKTEAGKNRIIPIHPDILEYVKYFYSKGGNYLLSNEAGHKMDADNFRKRDYYPLLVDLEIKPKNPHCTRHTFTSMIHASGAKKENIIKLVGHTDFRTTTENYIHQSVSELYETVKLLKI